MKRCVLTILVLLCMNLTANAQLFRRNQGNYCPGGNCQGSQCKPATLLPPEPAPTPEPEFPTGVVSEGLAHGYHLNGVKVTKEQAYSAVETTLPELNKKWRLVVVGTTDQRKEALAKIGTKDSVVINAFPPDHFYVKDLKPNTLITLMRPDGEVVADGNIGDVEKVMAFTARGPFEPQPKPPIPAPHDDPPAPPAPPPDAQPWYAPANWVHLCCVGCGVLLTFLARYGFPLVRNFLASKLGSKTEAEIEALVNAKLAAMGYPPIAPSLPDVPQPATPVANWK